MGRQRADGNESHAGSHGKTMRVDVAAVGPEGNKAVGVLEAQVPGAGRSHRHAAQHDAGAIDAVVALVLAHVVEAGEPSP